MESSVARLDPRPGGCSASGGCRIRASACVTWPGAAHMEGRPLLGIGLQAEHEDPARRSEAPVLAVWDGANAFDSHPRGRRGGLCRRHLLGAFGGFLLSSNRTNSALWWRPDQPGRLWLVARLTEAYALGSHGAGDHRILRPHRTMC